MIAIIIPVLLRLSRAYPLTTIDIAVQLMRELYFGLHIYTIGCGRVELGPLECPLSVSII
jgi:hypothetical protein